MFYSWLMKPFSKPYLPVPAQIALLKGRGLTITDDARATAALERIGYYRLSGYWYPLRTSTLTNPGNVRAVQDDFRPGSEFGQVVDLYVFDKKLRLLTLDAIERVEVALRTDIALLLGQHSPVAHRDPAFLHGKFTKTPLRGKTVTGHQVWLDRLDETTAKSREEFVEHFRLTYSTPLPIWMAVELWDFGMLSHFLAGMRHQDQTTLAAKYGLPRPELLTGWVRSINFARNLCAHHSRLWNRPLVDQPPLPRKGEVVLLDHMAADLHLQKRYYAVAAVLRYLLRFINPTTTWANRLSELVVTLPAAPGISPRHMGFPKNWSDLPLWQTDETA
ncbi:MAG TPA: Abi family protein [Methylomirabilota bacterium]|nr:Abi family protein [Methylomirabilota bacterium]